MPHSGRIPPSRALTAACSDARPRKIRLDLHEVTIFGVPTDFRIDFAAAPALIGFAQRRPIPIMPADLQSSPVPLAEIAQGPNAFEQFLDRNQKNLIILAVLITIAVAALVVYRGIEKSRQETAGAALIKADNLTALQSVINEHAGTTAAASAAILLAERQWTDGQKDASIDTLRKFIAGHADHPGLPAAQASLGAKLMIQGKSAEATKIFQALIDDPKSRYIAPYALISLGDIAKLGGDLKQAEASYNRVKNEFSESSFADTAKRRVASLKAKPPVEVEPPPPPKPESSEIPSVLTPGTPPPAQSPTTPSPSAPEMKLELPPAGAPASTPPQESQPEPRNDAAPKDSPAKPQP